MFTSFGDCAAANVPRVAHDHLEMSPLLVEQTFADAEVHLQVLDRDQVCDFVDVRVFIPDVQ